MIPDHAPITKQSRNHAANRAPLALESESPARESGRADRSRVAWRAPSIYESDCGLEINCYATAGGQRARP